MGTETDVLSQKLSKNRSTSASRQTGAGGEGDALEINAKVKSCRSPSGDGKEANVRPDYPGNSKISNEYFTVGQKI